jgi:predicted dehydrogenase
LGAAVTVAVGIIGVGRGGHTHAAAVQQVADLTLVAYAGRSQEHLAAFGSQYPGQGYDDYRRLLDRPDVRAVAIATPHDLHARIAIDALHAGKHVFLEMPIARNHAECDTLAGVVREYAGVFMPALTNRYIPELVAVKRMLDEGTLGEVIHGFCGFTHNWNLNRTARFYFDRSLGGGILMTHGVRYIDRLLWLMPSKIVAVKGVLGRRFHTRAEHPADDAATTFVRFASGATGTVVLAGYRTGPVWHELHLVAERAAVRVDNQGLSMSEVTQWRHLEIAPANPMLCQWQAFARAIMEHQPAPATLDDALRVMDVIFAAEYSAKIDREYVVPDKDEGTT